MKLKELKTFIEKSPRLVLICNDGHFRGNLKTIEVFVSNEECQCCKTYHYTTQDRQSGTINCDMLTHYVFHRKLK